MITHWESRCTLVRAHKVHDLKLIYYHSLKFWFAVYEYTNLCTAVFIRKEEMAGLAELEEFDEALCKTSSESDEKYLTATSEQPLCGYYMDERLEEKS